MSQAEISDIADWFNAHDDEFRKLASAATDTLSVVASLKRLHDPTVAEATQALSAVAIRTSRFLQLVERARVLPRVPDDAANSALHAGLARWVDGGETLLAVVVSGDTRELARAARALTAGSAEFLRLSRSLGKLAQAGPGTS